MIDKTKIIYKGDMVMSYYYLGFGLSLLASSLFLYFFTVKLSWIYLIYGLGLLGIFCLGKGYILHKVSKARFKHYNQKTALSLKEINEEIEYNKFRLDKKALNRRRYLYTIILCIILLIWGFIIDQRGLSIGTLVPVILYAGTEFCLGLLTEFRLWEYHRQIEKEVRL